MSFEYKILTKYDIESMLKKKVKPTLNPVMEWKEKRHGDLKRNALENLLNEYGDQGWELIFREECVNKHYRYFFKRLTPEEKKPIQT